MKVAVLILGIFGSLLAFGIGACSGMLMGGLGELADDGGEGAAMGGNLFLFAILQTVLGLVFSVMAYTKMNKNLSPTIISKVGLLIAGGLSITNTMVFLTAGVCHIVGAILCFVYKPTTEN